MYTNIPIEETIAITKQHLIDNKMNINAINETISLLKIITKQNYFMFKDEFYIQEEGLPMGSPLSGTLANIYLNHLENNDILNSKNKLNKNIIYWHRYVDDILILFDGTHRQLITLHKYINNIHKNIKFTLEVEESSTINFLDLTIQNEGNKHKFKVYRKPTQTDHTIDKSSNHPIQHKMAAYNHLIHRLNLIPMTNDDYLEELNIIKYIAVKNGYSQHMIDQMNNKYRNKQTMKNLTTLKRIEENTKKYIKVEFDIKTNKIMQKILHKHGYNIAFSTKSKLGNKVNNNHQQPEDTGVYKITCGDCQSYYIGQTGRCFETRFKEHVQDISRTVRKSNFAEHIATTNHNYEKYEDNLQILHRCKKGQMMNRIEELEIYRNKDDKKLLNDKINTKTNLIYDIIINNIIEKEKQ